MAVSVVPMPSTDGSAALMSCSCAFAFATASASAPSMSQAGHVVVQPDSAEIATALATSPAA